MKWACLGFEPYTVDNGYSYKLRGCIVDPVGTVYDFDSVGDMLAYGATHYERLFTFDGLLLWGYLQYYVASLGLPAYESLKDGKRGKHKVSAQCYSELGDSSNPITFKVWLYVVAAKYGGTNKDKRLKTVTVQNVSQLFGKATLPDVLAGFCGTSTPTTTLLKMPRFGKYPSSSVIAARLCDLVIAYDKKSIAFDGAAYLGAAQPIYLTATAGAKRAYLLARYGFTGGHAKLSYWHDHPQDKTTDIYLREGGLLRGGLLYANPRFVDRLAPRSVYKYDCNALYSYIASIVPDLSGIEPCAMSDIGDNSYEYIIVLNGLTAWQNDHANSLPLFVPPWETRGNSPTARGDKSQTIDFYGKRWAMFFSEWEYFLKYYTVIDVNIVKVYRLRKVKDKAIKDYCLNNYTTRQTAKRIGDAGGSLFWKLRNNGLMGKFGQLPIFERVEYAIDPVEGTVCKRNAELVDDWDNRHFDFVRGAYIYSRAKCYMFSVLEKLAAAEKINLRDHVYYMDTDSILTDRHLPAELSSPDKLGLFKLEACFNSFFCAGNKMYVGYNDLDDAIDFHCAGIPREAFFDATRKKYGDVDFAALCKMLSSSAKCDCPVIKRVRGGNIYSIEQRGKRWNAESVNGVFIEV